MNKFFSQLKHHFPALLTGVVFFVIGLIELYEPHKRPTGRWQMIAGPLWDSFGNLGISFVWWVFGVIFVFSIIIRGK